MVLDQVGYDSRFLREEDQMGHLEKSFYSASLKCLGFSQK